MMMKPQNNTQFDLGFYSSAAQQEGFCMLHDGVNEKWTHVFQHPIQTLSQLPETMEKGVAIIGHLSYPNPILRNDIPDQKFYEFEDVETHVHPKNTLIYQKLNSYTSSGKLEHSVTKAQYVEKIKEIKKLLAAGEIYQLNYAIRFRKKFSGDPYALFLKLAQSNPSHHSAFLNCGDYQIISNSPERLFKVENSIIMTEPIKGTISKVQNSKLKTQNSKLKTQKLKERFRISGFDFKQGFDENVLKLLESEKERSELDMITDLARNDVGRICEYGSLRLEKSRSVMELPNLWHTYSRVTGKLPSDIRRSEIINALFPGGSITGCPKKRAMEYIEKLEGLPRNIFTGSILFANKNVMEASIAIRTALVKNDFIEYWAGGGIVADSDPEAEYEECLLKAERFLSTLDSGH